jgi:septal ring factor EnvC (AmiA/AmiB activator)
VEEAIQLLLGGSSSDNLLSEFNSRLNSTTSSLAQKQQKITSLGKETASIEADIRNTRSHLEAKRSELNGTFQVN